MGFDYGKKFTYHALVAALKTNSRLFTIFQTLSLFSTTFPRSGKLFCKFQDFSKNTRLYKPCNDCELQKIAVQKANILVPHFRKGLFLSTD